jgi:hypothetical protein
MDSPGAPNLVRREDVEMHLMPDGSALLYDPDRNAGYALAPLGALVWDMCDGTYTTQTLLAELEQDLVQVQGIRKDADRCLSEFARLGLLTAAPDVASTHAEGPVPDEGIFAHPINSRTSTRRQPVERPKSRSRKPETPRRSEMAPPDE